MKADRATRIGYINLKATPNYNVHSHENNIAISINENMRKKIIINVEDNIGVLKAVLQVVECVYSAMRYIKYVKDYEN